MSKTDPFSARDTFDTGSGAAGIYRLSRLEDQGLGKITDSQIVRILDAAKNLGSDEFTVRLHDLSREGRSLQASILA